MSDAGVAPAYSSASTLWCWHPYSCGATYDAGFVAALPSGAVPHGAALVARIPPLSPNKNKLIFS